MPELQEKTLFEQKVAVAKKSPAQIFDEKNPQVWEKFREIAFKLINRGIKHCGAKAIFEYLRFHFYLQTTDPDFKLNNNYTAYYARKWRNQFPEHKDFFVIREQRKF